MGYGDVFEGDVEFRGSFEEVGSDAGGDGFSLGDEFGGVELGDDGFENFITDGGEDALVVVEAKRLGGVSGRFEGKEAERNGDVAGEGNFNDVCRMLEDSFSGECHT